MSGRVDKPRLLDLFCCAGGAAVGYHRAGFEVVGVDIASQPHYPFHVFQEDALDWLCFYVENWEWPHDVMRFDAIHASPPCQHFTKYRNAVKDITERYEDVVGVVGNLLDATGLPYVIENVEGAPLDDPVTLCGSMFDLDVRRHRLFEANWPLADHEWGCRHGIWSRRFKSSTGRRPDSRLSIEVGSWDEPLERQKAAMGVDWQIDVRELSEAIPPAYTEFIGLQLMSHLEARVAM